MKPLKAVTSSEYARTFLDRHRGFVRAYAPTLADCRVGQAAFLEFRDGVSAVIDGKGLFTVANAGIDLAVLAEMIVAFEPITHAVAFAVHISLEASRRGKVSKK